MIKAKRWAARFAFCGKFLSAMWLLRLLLHLLCYVSCSSKYLIAPFVLYSKVHFYMSFYSIAFVLLAIQCLTGEINRVVLPIAYAEVACFFLVVAFLATDHFYDLWTLDTKRSVFDIASRMYETTPMVTWYIQCYHYERREGQQQRVRVNTHCAKAELRYSYWKDTSPLVNLKEVIRYSLAKVTVEKSWSGDYGTQLQKKRFLSRNKHDTHYEFIETMELLPYDHCPIEFLAWANLSVRSCLVHWAWYLLFHLIIVFTVPYRMYLFGFSTTIVEVKIHKQLFTYENPPTRTK